MTIKRMIIVLFLILSGAPLIAFGIINVCYFHQKLGRIVENDLQVAVSTQVKAIENFYEERAADANVLCQSASLTQFLKSGGFSDSVKEMLRSRVKSNRFIERITLLNPKFEIVLDSGEETFGEERICSALDPTYFRKELSFTGVIETYQKSGSRQIIAAEKKSMRETGCLAIW